MHLYSFGAKPKLALTILITKGSQDVNAQITIFSRQNLIIRRYWLEFESQKYLEINLKNWLLRKI